MRCCPIRVMLFVIVAVPVHVPRTHRVACGEAAVTAVRNAVYPVWSALLMTEQRRAFAEATGTSAMASVAMVVNSPNSLSFVLMEPPLSAGE